MHVNIANSFEFSFHIFLNIEIVVMSGASTWTGSVIVLSMHNIANKKYNYFIRTGDTKWS